MLCYSFFPFGGTGRRMGENRKRQQRLRNGPQIPCIRVPYSASDTPLMKVPIFFRWRNITSLSPQKLQNFSNFCLFTQLWGEQVPGAYWRYEWGNGPGLAWFIIKSISLQEPSQTMSVLADSPTAEETPLQHLILASYWRAVFSIMLNLVKAFLINILCQNLNSSPSPQRKMGNRVRLLAMLSVLFHLRGLEFYHG